MIKLIQIILLLMMAMNTTAATNCTPQVKKTKPPRLVNGEWVKDEASSPANQSRTDFESLQKRDYAFIFSGTYSKEVSFGSKKLSFIQTKKIWRGKVPKSIDLEAADLPVDAECNQLKFGEDYVFFAKLGPRNKPIKVKEFRKISPALKNLLGKPEKQWLRNRLIKTPKK